MKIEKEKKLLPMILTSILLLLLLLLLRSNVRICVIIFGKDNPNLFSKVIFKTV